MNSENRSKIHADARTGEISQNYTHLLLIRLLIEQYSTQPLGSRKVHARTGSTYW